MAVPNVLIIEDDSAIRKTMQKALKGEGYALLFAENGQQGLEMLAAHPPDLIFLDLRMPVMNGFEVLEKLSISPDDPYLVVVITGHGDDKDVARCFQQGINFFLRKPLSMAEVCGLARSCLSLKKTEAALRNQQEHLEEMVEVRTRNLAEQLAFQQALIDAIPTPVFFKDVDCRYTGCNRAFEEVLGLDRSLVIGRTVSDFADKKETGCHRRADLEVLKSGNRAVYEGEARSGDGSLRQMMFCKAPFTNGSGTIAGLIGTMFDITERKKAEEGLMLRSQELEEVNTALRVLLNQVSKAKEEIEEKIVSNIKKRVLPHLNQLEARLPQSQTRSYVDAVKNNLQKITNSFSRRISSNALGLSPREIQIADFVRLGKTNKEIARLVNISQNAVEFHRNNLRRKLGLKYSKTNLRTHLLSLDK